MKFKNLILFIFTLLSIRSYSQTKNIISVVLGVNTNYVSIHGSIGDFGYNTKSGTMAGVSWSHNFSRSVSLETGLLFSDNKTQETYIIPSVGEGISNGSVKMLTVPLLIKYSFLKYLYLDGGPLIDKQTNYTSGSQLNDQSGIGFELGIGANYSFSRFTVFINPSVREHAIVAFNNTGSNFNLFEAGAKLGIGYNF